jgi:hypothetical protein
MALNRGGVIPFGALAGRGTFLIGGDGVSGGRGGDGFWTTSARMRGKSGKHKRTYQHSVGPISIGG